MREQGKLYELMADSVLVRWVWWWDAEEGQAHRGVLG